MRVCGRPLETERRTKNQSTRQLTDVSTLHRRRRRRVGPSGPPDWRRFVPGGASGGRLATVEVNQEKPTSASAQGLSTLAEPDDSLVERTRLSRRLVAALPLRP